MQIVRVQDRAHVRLRPVMAAKLGRVKPHEANSLAAHRDGITIDDVDIRRCDWIRVRRRGEQQQRGEAKTGTLNTA
jgi:hypothetical protein